MGERLSRANLAERRLERLSEGGRRNPDVWLVDDGERRVVVKDFAPRGRIVRRLLGRFLLRRERRAYDALADHPAVPRLLGALDDLSLVLEYRPGRILSPRLNGALPPGFVAELRAAVDGLHRRGVLHLDLRHRGNMLAGEDGRPVLVDFASALCLRPHGLAARVLLPALGWIDRRAVAKWERVIGG